MPRKEPAGRLPDGKLVRTPEDVEARREYIFNDYIAGMKMCELAKKYEVSTQTVRKDIRKIQARKKHEAKIKSAQVAVEEIVNKWNIIMFRAESLFEASKSIKDKVNVLNLMIKVLKGKAEFAFAAGILMKADDGQNSQDILDGLDISKLDVISLMKLIDEKTAKIQQLKQKISAS